MVHCSAPEEARALGMTGTHAPQRSDEAACARLDFQPAEYDHSTTYRANAHEPSAQNGRISQSEEDKYEQRTQRRHGERERDPAYRRGVVSSRASGVVSAQADRIGRC
ncbi:hypothetical protein BURKHO8Y_140418 [Burkholderia sp. 8Y]|nr:hypothetical protein BURKHO8Y_140418 [Burkholderia sp. 8Y]